LGRMTWPFEDNRVVSMVRMVRSGKTRVKS
jgi:hypothetical protein